MRDLEAGLNDETGDEKGALRPDVARLLRRTADVLSHRMRSRVREVAARVFQVPPEEFGPVRPGEDLGPYRIVRLIGLGGQAFVYEAAIGRRVALKIPRPLVTDRLLREARMAARIEHPDILRIEDVREDRGIRYLVMELATASLADRLGEHPEGFPEPEVRRILGEVLRALAHAHEQGVVHRDLKPANLLVGARGAAHAADGVCASGFGVGLVTRL